MRPLGRRPLRILLFTLVGSLALTGCGLVEPVTREGKNVVGLYNLTFVLALIVFVGVNGTLLISIIRFRKKPGDDTLPPQTHGNTMAEIIWTALPSLVVLMLFVISYSGIKFIDEDRGRPAAVIHVRGFQWSWEFDYGDGKVLTQESADKPPVMVVPVGETIRIVESSDNVIHAFYVPNFLFKRDAVPGRHNEFQFRVDVPGSWKGQCAEFCGTKHADMTFGIRAVSRAQFDKFVAEIKTDTCTGEEQESADLELSSPAGETTYSAKCLVAPADEPVKLTYENPKGLPHNVAIARDPGLSDIVIGLPENEVIDGATTTYDLPALPAGDYTFFCQVHPQMKGTYKTQ